MSATVTTTTKTVPSYYKKKLEGVQVNDKLLGLWRECYSQVQNRGGPTNDTSNISGTTGSLTRKEAIQIIKDCGNPQDEDPPWVPINVVQALQVLMDDASKVEDALQGTSLVFTPPPATTEETKGQRRWKARMGRLRLQNEETKYMKLTNNLQQEEQDDITGKSMTYAASVGLNMIIAPLSFGCFMYFFAGGVFDYFLGEEFSSRTAGGTDIKRVIIGVVSGVAMLFIEMILFVIRTHEYEAHTLKKKKKRKPVQPFGVYSKQIDDPLPASAVVAAANKSKPALVKKQE